MRMQAHVCEEFACVSVCASLSCLPQLCRLHEFVCITAKRLAVHMLAHACVRHSEHVCLLACGACRICAGSMLKELVAITAKQPAARDVAALATRVLHHHARYVCSHARVCVYMHYGLLITRHVFDRVHCVRECGSMFWLCVCVQVHERSVLECPVYMSACA